MKKLLLLGLMGLVTVGLVAQDLNGKLNLPKNVATPAAKRYVVNFESHHGESFTVFMDGNEVNRMPQSRVVVRDVSDQTHEVVVVLKRPESKVAVLQLLPGEATVTVNVNYDSRSEMLSLFTPAHNRADKNDLRREKERMKRAEEAKKPTTLNVNSDTTVVAAPGEGSDENKLATEEDLKGMLARMKAVSFDSDRLALGKVIVASSNLTADQIARLTETLDYSASQVELLKYAYHYCADPVNYFKTVDILTFTADKKKVMDYIATQH